MNHRRLSWPTRKAANDDLVWLLSEAKHKRNNPADDRQSGANEYPTRRNNRIARKLRDEEQKGQPGQHECAPTKEPSFSAAQKSKLRRFRWNDVW